MEDLKKEIIEIIKSINDEELLSFVYEYIKAFLTYYQMQGN